MTDRLAHLVVEEGNGLPGDALACILVLLRPQRELDEDLLQALVHVVDAQLLEPVILKDYATHIKAKQSKVQQRAAQHSTAQHSKN